MQDALTLWWLAGAVLIGLALPLAAIMLVIDHRRHRHWLSTGLAMVWCLLAASLIGVSAGNLSPPLFGVPLLLLYAILGDTDKAMAWLERAADTGFPCWPFFKIDPHLQNVREEPAFVRLVADLEATYTAIRIQRV